MAAGEHTRYTVEPVSERSDFKIGRDPPHRRIPTVRGPPDDTAARCWPTDDSESPSTRPEADTPSVRVAQQGTVQSRPHPIGT